MPWQEKTWTHTDRTADAALVDEINLELTKMVGELPELNKQGKNATHFCKRRIQEIFRTLFTPLDVPSAPPPDSSR